MELVSLSLFCLLLVAFVILDLDILFALLIGLAIFVTYALVKGHSVADTVKMMLHGVYGARNVIIVFILIGILTALWRLCGTIPSIICYCASLISPKVILLMCFLLCCLISILTGTSFGTAATMGVICFSVAHSMGINDALSGGAILAGSFFGDRISPVSTSALLVSELTGTNIFDNIKRMAKTAVVPFVLSVVLYLGIGLFGSSEFLVPDLQGIFRAEFEISPIMLLPALTILVLSFFKVKVKLTMLTSIAVAFILCPVRSVDIGEIFYTAIFGYDTSSEQLSRLLSGGGIVSMLRAAAIVGISSAYAGIFERTGMLEGIKSLLSSASKRITPYGGMLLTAVITSVIACNQTLAIMLTHQLCKDGFKNNDELALNLEDTAVVTAPLVPWSIACRVPLGSVGSPSTAILFAFFLYLLPIWRLLLAFFAISSGKGKKINRKCD